MPDVKLTDDDPPQDQRRKCPKEAIVVRMYYKEHLTDLVRLFGYSEISLDAVREKFKPLVEKYGRTLMEAAAEEIIFIDGTREPAVARLTDDARKLAGGILGRPSATTTLQSNQAENALAAIHDAASRNVTPQIRNDAPSANSAAGDSQRRAVKSKPSTDKPERLGRKEALRRFREWLNETKHSLVTIDHTRHQVQSSGAKLGTLDFILHWEPINRLVTVRNKLTPIQRHDMHEWQRIFGADFQAVRAWPANGPNGSTWHFHPIE